MKRAALIASIVGVMGVPVLNVPVLTAAVYAQASGPTDAQIDAALAAFKATDKSAASAQEAFKNIDLSLATREQIEKLHTERVLAQLPVHMGQARARLATLATADTVEGVQAAELLVGVWSRPRSMSPEDVKEYRETLPKVVASGLRHPRLLEAIRNGVGSGILSGVQMLGAEQLNDGATLTAARRLMGEDLPVRPALMLGSIYMAASDESVNADKAVLDGLRADTLAMYGRTLVKVERDLAEATTKFEASPTDAALKAKKSELEQSKSRLARMTKFMNGAYARGELVGHTAPDITFSWSTLPDGVTKLSDLKGKVVVLDFWATWCGPCISSFPNIRRLQERYKDYPVVILGVTSLQGFHIDYKATDPTKRRIDTSGNPSQETELMRQFIKDMEMTWPVAFGTEDVFNPEYGVQGIPHVAIVDPAGVVRFRGLHPGGDPAEEAEKIDGLLKEFKLPHPGTPLGMK